MSRVGTSKADVMVGGASATAASGTAASATSALTMAVSATSAPTMAPSATSDVTATSDAGARVSAGLTGRADRANGATVAGAEEARREGAELARVNLASRSARI